MLLVTSVLVASPVLFLISSAPAGDRSRECLHQDDEGCSRAGANADAFTCREEQCWEAARRVQASMDWRADPCRDFYAYACGGWARDASAWPPAAAAAAAAASLATLQRLVDLQLQNQLSLASTISPYQKLGAFYTSCLRVKERGPSYAPMLALLDELGGYLPPGAPPPDLTALVARLLQVNGAPLFDVDLDADPRNRSRLAIFLDLPRRSIAAGPLWQRPTGPLGLQRWFDGPPPAEPDPPAPAPAPAAARGRRRRAHPKESRAYAYMKSSAEEKRLLSLERLLRVLLPPALAKPTRAKELQAILLFASMLSKQFPREKDLNSRAAQREAFELFNVSRLQDEFGFVQWQPLLEEVFSRNFTDEDVFYVRAPDYMRRLQSMLLHFQRRVVHNALLLLFARDSLWELVDATALAGEAGGGAGDGGEGVGAGPAGGGRYWPGFCARVTVTLFSRAASALYLRQFAPAEVDALRDQVTALFERLKQTLAERVQRSAWLDEATRAAALHKLRGLRGHFLTWPRLWNASYAEALLRDVHVDPENFFNNVISRYRQMRKIPPDILENPVSEKKWAYPFVVNAFYVRSINSMVIPLAVLTQPTFRADVPRYVPYSTVGLLLAHEMVHAFDLAGIGHGADGAPHDWFSAPARLRLEARLDCVARQYAAAFTRQVAFLGSTVDIQFDWNATSNENMADIAALQVAHSAWRAALAAATDGPDARLPHINLSTRQLFFVAAAQSYCSSLTPEEYIVLVEVDHHTPYPERINGMMMNSPAFSEAFKCPVGSPMNPEKKCATW